MGLSQLPLQPASGPRGALGYAEIATNQTTIAAEVDITGLTNTVTVAAGRRLRISAAVPLSGSNAANDARLTVYQDGVKILHSQTHLTTAATSYSLDVFAVVVPAAGSRTYKVTLQRIGGTGTLTVSASANQIGFILVEDIGAA